MSYSALAEFYDRFTENNMDYEKRTEYLCALLCDLPAQAAILDLACGTGVYSFALMQRGYDVIGVDASLDMLNIALEKAGKQNVAPPLLLCQKLDELDLYGTARAAICLTDSLNHITNPAAVRRFFRRLALFLEPGSPFIFDVNTLYKHAHVLANNTFVYDMEHAFCAWQNRWAAEQRLTDISLDIFAQRPEGHYERLREHFQERVYAPEELMRWLQKAGFDVLHVYGELTFEAPQDDAERIFFVARRR